MTSTTRPSRSPSTGGAGDDRPTIRSIVTPRRLIVSIAVVLGLGLIGFGFSSTRNTAAPDYKDAAVEGTYPKPGERDLRQARIGIDLASGYTAQLKIDGVLIPDDQVERVIGLDQYFYTPGPGTETGPLAPDRHCATAVITKLVPPGVEQSHDFSWCFYLN